MAEANALASRSQGARIALRIFKIRRLQSLGWPFAFIEAASAQDVRLIGSKASFPFPIYSAWFKQFSKETRGVTADNQAKGNGAGIQDLINRTVDFAGSDAAMTDEEIAKVAGGVVLIPMTAG